MHGGERGKSSKRRDAWCFLGGRWVREEGSGERVRVFLGRGWGRRERREIRGRAALFLFGHLFGSLPLMEYERNTPEIPTPSHFSIEVKVFTLFTF